MIEEVIDRLKLLLQGKIPPKVELDRTQERDEAVLGAMLNQLIEFIQESHDMIVPLSQGKLENLEIHSNNFFASPFKELHSRLLHLTWQATQVAQGDFQQRVDFMGDFSRAFNSMIIALDQNEKMLKKKIEELENALAHITKLERILPICSHCKKIRLENAEPEDINSWVQLEKYFSDRTETLFSHGLCPDCIKIYYSDFDSED